MAKYVRTMDNNVAMAENTRTYQDMAIYWSARFQSIILALRTYFAEHGADAWNQFGQNFYENLIGEVVST
jgi:hypothetical protein